MSYEGFSRLDVLDAYQNSEVKAEHLQQIMLTVTKLYTHIRIFNKGNYCHYSSLSRYSDAFVSAGAFNLFTLCAYTMVVDMSACRAMAWASWTLAPPSSA